MTAADAWLDAAQVRADAATPGPWHESAGNVCNPGAGRVATLRGSYSEAVPTAEFIAAARTDLPAALAALRAVRSAAADLAHRGGALGDRRGGNGSIVAQQNEGRGQGYREAARLIESAIASALGVSEP